MGQDTLPASHCYCVMCSASKKGVITWPVLGARRVDNCTVCVFFVGLYWGDFGPVMNLFINVSGSKQGY